MKVSEFLSLKEYGKRVLIVSDLARGQALLRLYEKKTGTPVINVSCMTLRQIAEMLYKWKCAEEGYKSRFKLVDSREALMLFRSLVIKDDSLLYFNNPEMMDISTASEMFKISNLIRMNGWTGKEPDIERISDLKKIISKYEQALNDQNILDTVALYRFVCESNMPESEVRAVAGAVVYYLEEDTEVYSGLEKKVLENILGCNSDRCVTLFAEETSIKALENIRDKAAFYRGYGSFNEANHIANDILKKQLRYGNVEVLYSSQEQIPALSSALRGNLISTRIVSGYSIADNAYIALVRRLIDWAEDDFSETGLEKVLLSPVLTVITEEQGKKRNLLAGQRYFDHVLRAGKRREDGFTLGWGYERNAEFIEHEEKYVASKKATGEKHDEKQAKYLDSLSKILDMHKRALKIFGDGAKAYKNDNKVSSHEICSALAEFVKEFGMPSPEYAIGTEALSRILSATAYDEEKRDLKENIRIIRELADRISVADSEDTGSVTVRKMGEWAVVDRDDLYVTGMSLKDMQGNTTQSPILFDEELTEYLGDGYKPTIENETDRRERNILRTLMLFNGKRITFGYSSYDTVGFCESNPCGMYRDLLKEYGGNTEIKDLPEFVYGNPDSDLMVGGISSLPAEIEKVCDLKEDNAVQNMPVTCIVGDDCLIPIEYEEGEEYDDDLLADDVEDEDDDLDEEDEDEIEDDIDEDMIRPIVPHHEIKLNTSNSALESLLDCPKRYAYERLLYIPDNEYTEKDFARWLDAASKGSFFHEMAERYVNERLKKASSATIEETVDSKMIGQIAEEEKNKFLKLKPVAIQELADRETEEMIKTVERYFVSLTKELRNSLWRPVLTEQEFHAAKFNIDSFNKNNYDFVLNGFIDRIDYKIDSETKTVILRIVDYKTGRKDKKEKEKDLGKLIQYLIYENALMETGMTKEESENEITLLEFVKNAVSRQEDNAAVKEYKYEFECFKYDFPMEMPEPATLEVSNEHLERINLTRLRSILTITESDDKYPDHAEFYEKLKELKIYYPSVDEEISELYDAMTKPSKDGTEYMKPDESENCKYCSYRYLCDFGKAGDR